MSKPDILRDQADRIERVINQPETLEEVYQEIAKILSQPERRTTPYVIVQFDGFAPDIIDLCGGIEEIYPNYNSAGGFHWSVRSDKPIVAD
jgi:hypothetical protein